MTDITLQQIFYEIKPELKEIGDLHGCNTIDDLKFDSVDIVELITEMENALGIDIEDIETMIDIIQEFNQLEEWFEKRKSEG